MKRKLPIMRIFTCTAFLILLVASLIPLAPVQAAQTDKPRMTVTASYNGYFKYGEWLPIWVELENQSRDLDGEVRVQINASQGVVTFSTPVTLPSGSHKLVPLYVLPNNFSRELNVQLVSKNQVVATQKATVHPQPNISYFIGLLTPERGALALLNGLATAGQERPKILVDLTLADLPDRAEALRSFDLLIINDLDTSKITPEQSAALQGWVNAGGRLVIGGGANAQKTIAGLSQELVPATINTTGEAGKEEWTALSTFANTEIANGSYIAAKSSPTENSRVILGNEAFPVLVERSMGAGSVDFVAFDLAGLPFNGWPGTLPFWQTLLGNSSAYPQNWPFDMSLRQFRANNLVYPLSNIPSLDLPSIQGLSILLVIYILFVGPLNYLVLRRFKRMHLAWITIPVMTILFTAASFGIGYAMRGNDLVLNKIALVELKPDGSANLTSYMGLFSPRQTSYEVTIQGKGLISPMTGYDNNPWGGGMPVSGGEMVFSQGEPAVVKGLTVNQWAMQSFMSEGMWDHFGKVTGNLHIENDALVGKIKNETSYTIMDAVVVIQTRFARLGDMAPGQEKDVNLGLSNLQSERFGSPLSYRLYQEQNINGPLPRAMELKSNIISNLFENGMMSKFGVDSSTAAFGANPYNGILFFGWMNEAPPQVTVPGNRLTQQTTGLVYTSLEYNLPATGYLTLPAGLIPGSMTKTPMNGGTCGPMGTTSVNMGRGEAEFEFQVPDRVRNLQIDTLKMALWRDNGNQWGMPKVALYDWSSQNWTTIKEPIQGTNVIQKPGPYISESGQIRVKVTSDTDAFGCLFVGLGLEATQRAGTGG